MSISKNSGFLFYKRFHIILFGFILFQIQLNAQCLSGDCKNGSGIYLFPSGAKYIGKFKNGECDGIGVCYYTDGSKYQGFWHSRYPEGHGIKTYPDGSVRNGYWKKGKPVDENGQLVEEVYIQKEIKNDGTDIQSGCLTGNCVNGEGVMAYADGSKYEGSFEKSKISGIGTWYYPNNDKFVGNFANGLPNGKGTLYRADGTALSGYWKAGEFSSSTEIIEKSKTGCISGNCQNGQGVYIVPETNAKYEGQFVKGSFEGNGVITYVNGNSYSGSWQNGKYQGQGVLSQKDGSTIEGNWKQGEFNPLVDSNVIAQNIPSSKPTQPPAVFKNFKVYALIVGISQYAHMPVLRYSDDDAYKMFAFLKSPEGGSVPDERIQILIDEDATKQNIKNALKELYAEAGPDDIVLFYFAGHGLKGSFLPIDFDGFHFKLSHEEINEIMKTSKAKLNLCIVDACYSGSLVSDFKGDKDLMMKAYYSGLSPEDKPSAIFLSSKSEETSLESKGLRQGVFSYFLLRGLKGEADYNKDGVISIKELFDYVSLNVKEYTDGKQTPVIKGNFDEKMPIVVKNAS